MLHIFLEQGTQNPCGKSPEGGREWDHHPITGGFSRAISDCRKVCHNFIPLSFSQLYSKGKLIYIYIYLYICTNNIDNNNNLYK